MCIKPERTKTLSSQTRPLRIDTSDARRRRVTPNYHRRSSISHAHSKLQTISILDCSENSANLAKSFPQSRHNSRKQTHFKSGRPNLMHRHATLSLMTLHIFFYPKPNGAKSFLLLVFTICDLKYVRARCMHVHHYNPRLVYFKPTFGRQRHLFKRLFS